MKATEQRHLLSARPGDFLEEVACEQSSGGGGSGEKRGTGQGRRRKVTGDGHTAHHGKVRSKVLPSWRVIVGRGTEWKWGGRRGGGGRVVILGSSEASLLPATAVYCARRSLRPPLHTHKSPGGPQAQRGLQPGFCPCPPRTAPAPRAGSLCGNSCSGTPL